MTGHRSVTVVESSQVSAARLDAKELGERARFDETDAHRAGLVATELATNLVKHTTQGGVLLMRVTNEPSRGVELIAIDRGPGIRDVSQVMIDGHSTAGSPGTGLGAVRRLSDHFDMFSLADRGTIVLARLHARNAPRSGRGALHVGAVSVPKEGEMMCGDGWRVRQHADGASILMTDGLGHGLQAAEASAAAATAFERGPIGDTARTLEQIHRALHHTRGAVGAVAEIRNDQGVIRYTGVGNITAAVAANGTVRQAVSNNGTLGHEARLFREYTYPWTRQSIFIMHSDGISARWSLDHYPGLRQHDPVVIAAVLYRDFSRSGDDATVLVGREAP